MAPLLCSSTSLQEKGKIKRKEISKRDRERKPFWEPLLGKGPFFVPAHKMTTEKLDIMKNVQSTIKTICLFFKRNE